MDIKTSQGAHNDQTWISTNSMAKVQDMKIKAIFQMIVGTQISNGVNKDQVKITINPFKRAQIKEFKEMFQSLAQRMHIQLGTNQNNKEVEKKVLDYINTLQLFDDNMSSKTHIEMVLNAF